MTTGSVLAQFTIHLSVAVAEPVEVSWHTADGTAKAGVDYAAASGVAIFAPGQMTKTVDVLVYGRAVGSEDRSFFVEMQPPVNAILGAAAGECIIHVDTTGSTPVTQVIVPTGPRGIQGKSAYQVWLDLGNTGTEQDFIDSLSPSPQEIAAEVAPLLNMGNSPVTAEGTESLSKPDTIQLKALARRVAYVGAAKIATVALADGDNLIANADLTGDVVDFHSVGMFPRIVRGSAVISPVWSVEPDGRLLVKSALAGDVLYACQYDTTSPHAVKTFIKPISSQAREALRRSYAEAGYQLVEGSFESGATLISASSVAIHEASGKAFSGSGPFPQNITQGTSPTVGFTDRSDALLANKVGVVEDEIDKLTHDVVVIRPIMGVADDTDRVNDILENHTGIYFSEGIYNIDPDIGIKLRNGSIIDGAGFMKALLIAKQVGATVPELAAYSKGSVIKRAFTPGVANDYVSGVRVDNISVIMRHPTTIDAANYRQIALDLRNCDRSWVGQGFYAGNTTLPGMPFTWEPPRATQAQGYGIVYGTRNSNSIDYCGGVGGIAESPKVYGARKNIVVDDNQLSPESAAHATIVRSPDLQIGVELISQASQYNAGTVFEDCLLQSTQRFESSDITIGLLMAGYNCSGTIRYLEGGPNCDITAALTSTSADCEVDILYASVTGSSSGSITDNGTNNSMSYREMTAVSGGKTTKGRLVETFNKGYRTRRVVSTFVNMVGPQTVTGDAGVSVSRSAAAGYNITLDKPFSGEFGVNITAKTNPSRQGFSFAYSAKTNNSIHVDTYVNNSLLDPEQMTIEIFQV